MRSVFFAPCVGDARLSRTIGCSTSDIGAGAVPCTRVGGAIRHDFAAIAINEFSANQSPADVGRLIG